MNILTNYQTATDNPQITQPIPVLDKGYVQLVDWSGGDYRIVDAARVSYQKGTKRVRQDSDLINYLMRKGHMSPFELVNLTFEIKMPLFLVAQWKRYRTAKLNEQSARYSEMVDEFWVPQKIRIQDKNNKQSSDGQMNSDLEKISIQEYNMAYESAYKSYQFLLDNGVPREQARAVLPTGLYTTLIWQQDLRNIFNMLNQRIPKEAQDEIREYAKAIEAIIAIILPDAYEAFQEYQLFAENFGGTDMVILREFVSEVPEAKEFLDKASEHYGYSKSKKKDFLEKIFGKE